MPYGGGLSASLGVITESAVGTEATVNAWYEILGHTLSAPPTFLDSAGLKAGQAFKRSARTVISRYDVNGDITLEHVDKGTTAVGGKGMGFWWKHALGSTAVPIQIAATTAWRQSHFPGPRTGISFTTQIGSPQTDGTVRAFTYRGVKCLGWEFTCSDGQIAQLKLNIDAWRENTATGLVAPVYAGSSYQSTPFSFADASVFTLGGTATTTTNVTSVAGGTPLTTVCKGITLTGTTPLANERYGLGNAGTKKEQIENGIPTITGTLDAEFTSRTEIYDLFVANTTTVLQLDFAHGDAGTSNPYRLSFILPAVKFKTAQINLNSADILTQSISFEAYDDGSGSNPPIQVQLVSQDQVI
jgi:hypothetical protein